MTATTIFPLAPWLEGTNQNSTPANDNSLRVEAMMGPAMGFAAAAPGSPADHDQWVISAVWGGFSVDNIVIYLGGTWTEFAVFNGLFKSINDTPYFRHNGYWDQITVTGS